VYLLGVSGSDVSDPTIATRLQRNANLGTDVLVRDISETVIH